MRKRLILIGLLLVYVIGVTAGCGKRQDAYNNNKITNSSADASGDLTSTDASDDLASVDASGNSSEDTTGKDSSTDNTSTEEATVNPNAIVKNSATYDCDIKADQKSYDGHVDITVGDNYYATQINDWYMNFDQYEGKVVEIEGYYVGDFQPYDFIGRYGPSCPYCQGGYVSFEILTDEDVSNFQSAKDWIKVTGILRQGTDSDQGVFYYIEVLKLEKMDQVGKDTVTN